MSILEIRSNLDKIYPDVHTPAALGALEARNTNPGTGGRPAGAATTGVARAPAWRYPQQQALSDINAFARHPAFQLVAVADVDLGRFEAVQQRFPTIRVYQDWRELLDRETRNIDSVSVATPDHMHGLIAMKAMERGKAVYVEKPLCSTLRETRQLTEYARRRRLTTQMGIQISSTRDQLYGEALVRRGVVGKIREVHTFSNKSWGDGAPLVPAGDPVPAPFDWDGWLGVGADRPFIKGAYHPGQWRRRVGFGTGTLGDMGCHIYSPPYRALNLSRQSRESTRPRAACR